MTISMRTKRIALAAMAAVLLLTGALNVRSVIGGDDDAKWRADPGAPSAIDQLVGTTGRLPSKLDDLILSLQETLREDPKNGKAATLLGQAYLQRARETGDPSYYPKAETLFEQALDRDEDDFEAMTGLGTLALARHDFARGLTWGERARALNPYYPAAFGVIADALIELGRYDEAVATIQTMVDLRPDLPSFSRVSYIRELYGDVDGAITAMEQAAQAGSGRAENVAWTRVQIGHLRFGRGDLAGARREYEASLVTLDGYVYGLAGVARVEAAEGNFERAIEFYRRAIATMPAPEFVIELTEVYVAAGQPEAAARQAALVEAMQRLYRDNGVDTDVELALFDADHDRNLADAVKRARSGYDKRPSIRTADVLAWTLYKSGDSEAARRYSQEALRLGTADALLHFHAGMIEAALGNREAAIEQLRRALAINPHFSVRYAPEVVRTLAELQGA